MKTKPKNLKEFKALIKRYESITLEEIEKIGNIKNGIYVARKLAGFGNSGLCSLCICECNECIYNITKNSDCNEPPHAKSYYKVYNAGTPLQLRNAFRARAKHMKTLI